MEDTFSNSVDKKKKKSVFESDDEDFESNDEDDEGRTRGKLQIEGVKPLEGIIKSGEINGGCSVGDSDAIDTIYSSSSCKSEQINVAAITNVFANGYFEITSRIKNSKSCVNIKNQDNRCFLWCHLLHERYRLCENKKIEHPERLSGEKAYIYNNKIIHLDYDNIIFPIPCNNFSVLKEIETNNKIRINIFEYKHNKKMMWFQFMIVKIHLKIQ